MADEHGIIGLLRDAARAVQELDADNRRLRKRVGELEMTLHCMEEDFAMHSCHAEDWEDVQALLLDFRSGIKDEDELLEATVGRR